jgi:hypothetical protein
MDYWQWEEEEFDKRDKDATEGQFSMISLSPLCAYGNSQQNLQLEDVKTLVELRYGRKNRSQHSAHRLHGNRDYERKFRWDYRCQ